MFNVSNHNGRALSESELRRIVPSVFAQEPWHATSQRYTFIPTIEVVQSLAAAGFNVVAARQARSRTEGKAGFTRHLLRLRCADVPPLPGGVYAEALLTNSHDGSGSYRVTGGAFRLICTNGMAIPAFGPGSVTAFSTRHTGNVIDEVIAATAGIMVQTGRIGSAIESMQALTLTPDGAARFATRAVMRRFGRMTISHDVALASRRAEDDGLSLWAVLNRVQENLLRGGMLGAAPSGRRVRVRAIQGIDSDIALNQALWSDAMSMVQRRRDLSNAA